MSAARCLDCLVLHPGEGGCLMSAARCLFGEMRPVWIGSERLVDFGMSAPGRLIAADRQPHQFASYCLATVIWCLFARTTGGL